jgi:bifunctional non-homologous end joining protein LigD
VAKRPTKAASAGKPTPARKTWRRDPLRDYAKKRDFERTTEPAPEKEPRGKRQGKEPARDDVGGLQFVVQMHDARRLHYDLRLELGGTLKSWAVTRGPSLLVGEKRLAVRTEDHPMQYLDFEGNIPKGEYGGGAMIVWDRGRWTSAYDPEFGLKKGHLDITLHGSRLQGRWHLVRMRPKRGEKTEPWLLIKAEDAFARQPGEADITEEETTSFLSGRTTKEVAAEGGLRKDHAGRAEVIGARKRTPPDPGKLKGARKGILPAFLEPSLPQVVERPPSGPIWVHEIKYDGYRTQARIDGTNVQLLTRKGLDWTKRFPTIAKATQALGLASALLDGEIVVEDSAGIPSFGLLQADLAANRHDRFRYFLFDLLYCEGFDLTKAALVGRKALLQQIVEGAPATSPLRFSEHLAQDGPTMFEHACRLGLEGIVSKRADEPYRAGRGEHWLKTKSVLRQEFVILGYVPSTVAKGTVGALLVGYHDGGKLHYAGRVGTGYSGDQSRALREALDVIEAPKPKLANSMPAGSEKGLRWAKPLLVCEVEFQAWTEDQLIRQSSFKGMREDRPSEEIVLEAAPSRQAKPNGAKADRAALHRTKADRASDASIRARLTHPERILWPEPGVTKEGLAEFYAGIADWILPHLTGRVLSLVRHPSGVNQKGFFAKHAWAGLSKAVKLVDVGEKDKMLAIDNLDGLIDMVQAGVVEIHPWGSTVANLEKPDRLIFDLDPAEDVPWSVVNECAFDVRDRLAAIGLKSFVKTSGGKGLHVVLPIEPTVEWDEAKAFTQTFAETMAKARPHRYVAIMSKTARRGRIFIDYLRNGRGATAVAAYSTRALPAATVSTPLDWSELSDGIRSDHFRIDNLRKRLDVLGQDPWADFFTIRQRLPSGEKR